MRTTEETHDLMRPLVAQLLRGKGGHYTPVPDALIPYFSTARSTDYVALLLFCRKMTLLRLDRTEGMASVYGTLIPYNRATEAKALHLAPESLSRATRRLVSRYGLWKIVMLKQEGYRRARQGIQHTERALALLCQIVAPVTPESSGAVDAQVTPESLAECRRSHPPSDAEVIRRVTPESSGKRQFSTQDEPPNPIPISSMAPFRPGKPSDPSEIEQRKLQRPPPTAKTGGGGGDSASPSGGLTPPMPPEHEHAPVREPAPVAEEDVELLSEEKEPTRKARMFLQFVDVLRQDGLETEISDKSPGLAEKMFSKRSDLTAVEVAALFTQSALELAIRPSSQGYNFGAARAVRSKLDYFLQKTENVITEIMRHGKLSSSPRASYLYLLSRVHEDSLRELAKIFAEEIATFRASTTERPTKVRGPRPAPPKLTRASSSSV